MQNDDAQNDNMLIKQTICPICRGELDFFSDTDALLQCKSCNTVYHGACQKAIAKCSTCHETNFEAFDNTFVINDLF